MVNGLLKNINPLVELKLNLSKISKYKQKEYLQKFIDGDLISVQFFVEK